MPPLTQRNTTIQFANNTPRDELQGPACSWRYGATATRTRDRNKCSLHYAPGPDYHAGIPHDYRLGRSDWRTTATQACTRVRTNREPGEAGFDGPAYLRNHFFLLPIFPEVTGPELTAAEFVKALFLPFMTPGEPPGVGQRAAASVEDSLGHSRARGLVHGALAEQSVYKFYAGFADFGVPGLAANLWDRPEHASDDCLPGTWGEISRYGAVHYQQTRTITPMAVSEIGQITEVGMLEAVASS
ncbi:hypothetical protein BJY01DRAFT_139009 [Aspergillus pseudoustus]|uniref:Uncharacterized protein n=1 Tax=Aspergillus pseudoustus TaxID=1810923 RepID=A0ABR4II48_9EURO